MSRLELNQNSSYEWYGSFWFPEKDESKIQQFSGKISYKPETGIKISISNGDNSGFLKHELITRKIMHGLVHGENQMYITLLNVFFNSYGTIGNPTIRILSGSAEYLIADTLLNDTKVKSIQFEYDDFLNNFFTWRREKDSLILSKKPALPITNGIKIQILNPFKASPVYEEIDIENTFHTFNKPLMKELKKAILPLIRKYPHQVFSRNSSRLGFSFKKIRGNSNIETIKDLECSWRELLEIFLNHVVKIKRIHILISYRDDNNKIKNLAFPVLQAVPYDRQPTLNKPKVLPQLSINISSFQNKDKGLRNLEHSLSTWIDIKKSKEWNPVTHEILRAFKSEEKIIDTSQYASLISVVETFLDLIGEKETNTDKLIELYSDKIWIKEFKNLSGKTRNKESLGKWAQEIRNVIVHPKSAQKKYKGKYWLIASDSIFLHKVYVYLSSLLLKAYLTEQTDIEAERIKSFCEEFIKSRIFQTVIYK